MSHDDSRRVVVQQIPALGPGSTPASKAGSACGTCGGSDLLRGHRCSVVHKIRTARQTPQCGCRPTVATRLPVDSCLLPTVWVATHPPRRKDLGGCVAARPGVYWARRGAGNAQIGRHVDPSNAPTITRRSSARSAVGNCSLSTHPNRFGTRRRSRAGRSVADSHPPSAGSIRRVCRPGRR